MSERIRMVKMLFSKQQVIRAVFGQGGRLFPDLAGRLAFALFCRTDDPRKPSQGERAAIDRAMPLMKGAMHHRLKMTAGYVAAHQFPAHLNIAKRGRALVLHGWRSRTDFMAKMIVALTEDGWEVIGLDLPGHGQSSGQQLNIKIGVEAVHAATRLFGQFDIAIGHSFGGVVAVNAAVGGIKGFDPVPFERIAIIASPNSMPDMFVGVGHYFGLRPRAQRAMEERVEHVAGNPLASYVLSDQLKRLDGKVLIAHAPDDREVAYSGALEMAKAGPHVTLLPFDGLGHRRIIADDGVMDALVKFAD
jgi:pimeloyl-ACP methyl ester carboxylesterase